MRQAHDVLGVRPGASVAEVRAAYRRYVGRHHPDRGGDTAAFVEGEEAYRRLLGRSVQGQSGAVRFHQRRRTGNALRRAVTVAAHRMTRRPVPPPRVQ